MYTRGKSGSHRVVTPEGPANLRVYLIGPHPILLDFLDRMTFSRIARSCLGTPREGLLDHAQTLSILVQNIILSPAPLYRIAEWSASISPEALGINDAEKQSINDDRVARSLDALVSPRARSLFFRLALHIIKQFELDTRRIHHDTTTVTFHGRYESSIHEPRIIRGINKDHRPDLKQLVFGLNVTADGAVPLSHEVYSGNRTDDTVHTEAMLTGSVSSSGVMILSMLLTASSVPVKTSSMWRVMEASLSLCCLEHVLRTSISGINCATARTFAGVVLQ